MLDNTIISLVLGIAAAILIIGIPFIVFLLLLIAARIKVQNIWLNMIHDTSDEWLNLIFDALMELTRRHQ